MKLLNDIMNENERRVMSKMNKKLMLFAKIALSVSVFLSFSLVSVFALIEERIRFIHVLCIFLFTFLPLIAIMKIFYDEYTERLVSAEARFQREINSAFASSTINKKRLLYAVYLYTAKKQKRSIKLLEKLKDKCENPTEYRVTYLFLALNYTSLQKYREAIYIYEDASDLRYANATFYSNLGHLYSKTGDRRRAHQNYDIALSLDQNNVVALHNKSYLYYKEGKFADARKLLERVQEINPTFSPSVKLLSSIYLKEGDLDALYALKSSDTSTLSATSTFDLTFLK